MSHCTSRLVVVVPLLLAVVACTNAAGRTEALGVTFVVDSLGDERDDDDADGVCRTSAGTCTLRAALEQANATAGLDTIAFAIPGPGPHRITPRFWLPFVEDPVLIDGSTQAGYRANAAAVGWDGAIQIEIDGSRIVGESMFDQTTLVVLAPDVTLRGVAFINGPLLDVFTEYPRFTVEGCFLGVDASGNGAGDGGLFVRTDRLPSRIGGPSPSQRNVIVGIDFYATDSVIQNTYIGVTPTGVPLITEPSPFIGEALLVRIGSGNLIGGPGPGEGNVIVGGAGAAIHMLRTDGNQVIGNTIGLGPSGEVLGQRFYGVLLNEFASDNLIADNVVAHSDLAGILVGRTSSGSSVRNELDGNLIYGAGLAIDLSLRLCADPRGYLEPCPDGVTPNDPDDADGGPNGQQNYPVLGPVTFDGTDWIVSGHLDTVAAGAPYRIQVFSAAACHPTGHGPAESLVADTTVPTDAAGDASFTVRVPGALSADTAISATATSADGNTSELSACRTLNSTPILECAGVVVSADASCSATTSIVRSATDPDGQPVVVSEMPPAPYPLGDTSVTATATDPIGASATCSATVTVVDTTAPAVTCPAGIAVPAETPSGAPATFAASATDNCGPVTAACSPPSGTVFAIGDTAVECAATDAATNRGSCTFVVHVLGPDEQLTRLRDDVHALGLIPGIDTSLVTRLEAALAAIDLGDTATACVRLASFIREVTALAGTQIPATEAAELIEQANRIRAVIGCA